MTIAKKREPISGGNHIRAASFGEAARLQKLKKTKEMLKKQAKKNARVM